MSVSTNPKMMILETPNSWVSRKSSPQLCGATLISTVVLKMHLFLTRKGSSLTFGEALVSRDDHQSFGSATLWHPSATPYRPLSDRLDKAVTNGRVPWTQKGATNVLW